MANFHTDTELQHGVLEHLTEAKEYFNNDHIVGIFYQGSGNYGLDYENSDIDTKLITTPTLNDLVFNKPAVSTTHVRENNEHIDFKDMRLYIQTFRKQNLNFLEILFTNYKWVNPMYEPYWNRLVEAREAIAHLNPYLAVKAMNGVAKEKYFAMEHKYPSKLDVLEKYGYDPKQLHHLLRIEEYIHRYIEGEYYVNCLKPNISEYLLQVKKGLYNLEDARKEANLAISHIDSMCEKFYETTENVADPLTNSLLDEVQYDVIHASIKNDLITEEHN